MSISNKKFSSFKKKFIFTEAEFRKKNHKWAASPPPYRHLRRRGPCAPVILGSRGDGDGLPRY